MSIGHRTTRALVALFWLPAICIGAPAEPCLDYQPSFEEFAHVLSSTGNTDVYNAEVRRICVTGLPGQDAVVHYHVAWPEAFSHPVEVWREQRCMSREDGTACEPPTYIASADDIHWIDVPKDMSARQIAELLPALANTLRPGEAVLGLSFPPHNGAWRARDHGYHVHVGRAGLGETRRLQAILDCEATGGCQWATRAASTR